MSTLDSYPTPGIEMITRLWFEMLLEYRYIGQEGSTTSAVALLEKNLHVYGAVTHEMTIGSVWDYKNEIMMKDTSSKNKRRGV